jgi:hypothetical protein
MQLIGIGVRILRRHWKALIAASLLFGGIGLIFSEIVSAHFADVLAPMITTDALGQPVFSASDADLERLGWAFLLSMAGSLVAAACLTVASLVASVYVEGDYRGRSITFRAAIVHALRRAPVAIAAWLLTELALIGLIAAIVVLAILATRLLPAAADGSGGLGVLLALIVGVAGAVAVVTLSIRWSINAVVVALEPVGPVQALRRAWHLTADNAWRTFGLQLLVVLSVSLLSTVVAEIFSAFLSDRAGGSSLQFGAGVALSVVVGVLTAPILPVMLTALYFDLRVRRDRFELSVDPQP